MNLQKYSIISFRFLKVFHTLKCTFGVHCFLDTHSNVWCGMLHGLMGGRVIADIFICLFTLMVCDHVVVEEIYDRVSGVSWWLNTYKHHLSHTSISSWISLQWYWYLTHISITEWWDYHPLSDTKLLNHNEFQVQWF